MLSAPLETTSAGTLTSAAARTPSALASSMLHCESQLRRLQNRASPTGPSLTTRGSPRNETPGCAFVRVDRRVEHAGVCKRSVDDEGALVVGATRGAQRAEPVLDRGGDAAHARDLRRAVALEEGAE